MKYMSVSVYISPPRAKKLGSEASGLSESRVKRKAEKALSFVPGWSEWSSRGRALMQLGNNMKLWQGLGSALLRLGTPPEALRLISSPLASPEQVPALPTTQTSRHPGQHAVTSVHNTLLQKGCAATASPQLSLLFQHSTEVLEAFSISKPMVHVAPSPAL